MGKEQKKSVVKNYKVKDNGAKLVFDDPVLCAQFLRGYVDIDILKDVKPEDIEDISERFLPMWQEERNSDSVKLIHLKELPLFLITIIEHQSKIYYDMSFKILRYIVMVLTDYETEQEKLHPGITKTKIMLVNKLRSSADFKNLKEIPSEYFENLEKNTPEYLLKLIGKIIAVFLYRLNVPREEVEDFTDQIERREFTMLFDSFEAYDVQETRKTSKAEGKAEDVLELLSDAGAVPETVQKRILEETDLDILKKWVKLAARAESIDEFREKAGI